MPEAYPIPPERWPETPIVIRTNLVTGKDDGDDAGYRKRQTWEKNNEALVNPAGIPTREVYDGTDEYGRKDPSKKLPGGVRGGMLVVRETVARALDYAGQLLRERFAGEYDLVGLDGFRSGARQRAGWDRLRLDLQKEAGVAESEGIRVQDLFKYGFASDDTFAFVNPDASSADYQKLEKELRADKGFMQELEAAIRERNGKTETDALTAEDIDEGLFTYIAISANANKGRAAGRNIRLAANPMAHNSGAAIDAMLIDGRTGKLRSSVPFDHPGEVSRMDFLERKDAYEVYTAALKTNQGLRAHAIELGLNPDNLTRAEFEKMKEDQRVFYHLSRAIGATFYVGETWHLNGGLKPTKLDGSPIREDGQYANTRNVGSNTCDAQLRYGNRGVAAFGGDTAEAMARHDLGLET